MNINSSKEDQEKLFLKDLMSNKFNRYEERINPIGFENTRDLLRKYGNRLVCPKCTGSVMAWTGENTGYCPDCHYEGRSITVEEFVQKYF
jgi:ribosomal protein S27AE